MLKLELIITWAILENIFVCIQHPDLPPIGLSPVTDTLMSSVSCCKLKTLGRKNLLQAVTLSATAGQKHVSSLVLWQQLEVLILSHCRGGILVCQTPNELLEPHLSSSYFTWGICSVHCTGAA